MLVPVAIVDQAYEHRSLSLSNQSLKNWYPELNSEAEEIFSLQPWPGSSQFSSIPGTNPGGMHVFGDVLYKVTDNTMYSVSSSGIEVSRGTINGSSMCSFDSSRTEMVIVRDGHVYSYVGNVLTEISEADQNNPDFVTYINNQAVYDGAEGLFRVSDAGDLTAINALNKGNPLKSSGTLIRPFAFDDIVYMFKSGSNAGIEPWYNSKVGNPPFDPYQGQFIENVATDAGHSIAANENFCYFLGSDNRVYQLKGVQVRPVSTVAISKAIENYTNKSTATAFCMTWDNQNFYVLRFPSEATWVYNETSNGWFELDTGVTQSVYNASSYVIAYGKQLIEVGSDIHELDRDLFTNNGETIIRERTSYPLTAAVFGRQFKGRSIQVKEVEVIASVEPALSGQGSTPTIKIAYSTSDGRSWTSRDMTATNAGAYTWKFRTQALGQGSSFLFRLRVSDPIFCSIEACNADVELCVG